LLIFLVDRVGFDRLTIIITIVQDYTTNNGSIIIMPTVAEYLAQQLAQAGVTIVYGLPGGENVEVLDAIRKQGIEFVLVKNESSACFMADVHARLTGTMGVALTTLGPGATNAYVGLAHAYLERSPVLLITAQSDPHLIGTHTHQVIDLQSVFQPITKFTANLTYENSISTIHHALRMAQIGRPGPVHLGINNRVALQGVSITESNIIQVQSPKINMDTITSIETILRDNTKPVIVVGLGLEKDKPYHQVQQLAEILNAPVIDTPKSKGALPARHPLFAGTIGLTRTDPAYEILDEADYIIAIGFDVVEMVKPWNQLQPLIWIANCENYDPRIPSEVEFIGELSSLLDALNDILEIETDETWGRSRIAEFRAKQNSILLPSPQEACILPQQVLAAIRDNTPDDVIITTDVGSHKIFTALNWQAQLPNQYFVSNGLSAMGFGLTSAIAAAKITGKPTICITGDAGLAMVMGELGLLVELDLPVIIMVMNDSALDLIRSAQKRRQRPAFGTEFTNPDYEHIAKAYRLDYRRVQKSNDCQAAIQYALQSQKPILIEAMIDPVSYPTTVKENKGEI
jgi:acetolactate synthase I/II/III large subunit